MAMAEVNGVRLHYQQLSCERTEGEIEDVVLIHGLAANLAFWYLQIGHALARNYRVTMYDLRGHGRSSMPLQGYTPAEQAEDLRQLLDHLGIGRAHFIAHSFGGTIALNLACEQPQRFRSLTIADTHIAAIRNVGADWRYADHIQRILHAPHGAQRCLEVAKLAPHGIVGGKNTTIELLSQLQRPCL